MIAQTTVKPMTLYYQKSTTNLSFLDMHYFLKSIGIEHNKFMLLLYDPDLSGVDPYDPKLSFVLKQKISREVCSNYFYFIREVVRMPVQGGPPAKYHLNRGNLALNYCLSLNLNVFLELPRQQGKTIGAVCRYLWLYMFGTVNSEINFLNKKLDDSKDNLRRLREIKDMLPQYLKTDIVFKADGKEMTKSPNIQSLQHPVNRNKIRTVPAARNKAAAASLLRGHTTPLVWADEFAFILYNKIIYLNMMPAFKTASKNARLNHAPYGILLTTTPGFLATDEGRDANIFRTMATPFNEYWYNLPYNELMDLINANQNSPFVYIRFDYKQLGCTEEWFRESCKDLLNDWPTIRREVLLEWSDTTENSPFQKEDLDTISQYIKQPIRQVLFLGRYIVNIYEELNFNYRPIMGVDVSGGYNRDSSAITIIDSWTTRVTADFNCNYISPIDLAALIIEIVTKYISNAIVNVERNGGFGASVLAKLLKSPLKYNNNLYYEIKDRVLEERIDASNIYKRSVKTKVYGFDNTGDSREKLMEILRDRVDNHKDKIVSNNIYQELLKLEQKRNGKIEHSANSHDDSTFSWLLALYVYYEAPDAVNTWGLQKQVLKTDQDLDEPIYDINMPKSSIIRDLEMDDETTEMINQQLRSLNINNTKSFNQWLKEEKEKDLEATKELLSTPLGREALSRKYNEPIESLSNSVNSMYTIPTSVFTDFYND